MDSSNLQGYESRLSIFQLTTTRENIQAGNYSHCSLASPGLPRSGKIIWKMKKNFQVREFCGWSGKFRKGLKSQGKVREFENKCQWQTVFRKFIYSVQEGKGCLKPSPSSMGATLKGKNLLPWGANSFL